MKEARILIVDRSERIRSAAGLSLAARGHRIVDLAGSVVAAEAIIKTASQCSTPVDAVLVAGDLGAGSKPGEDGAWLTAYARDHLAGVKVVAWSIDHTVEGADVTVARGDVDAVVAHIAALPERTEPGGPQVPVAAQYAELQRVAEEGDCHETASHTRKSA